MAFVKIIFTCGNWITLSLNLFTENLKNYLILKWRTGEYNYFIFVFNNMKTINNTVKSYLKDVVIIYFTRNMKAVL